MYETVPKYGTWPNGRWCSAIRSGFQSVLLDGVEVTTVPSSSSKPNWEKYFYNDLNLSAEPNTNNENNIAVTLRFPFTGNFRAQTIKK